MSSTSHRLSQLCLCRFLFPRLPFLFGGLVVVLCVHLEYARVKEFHPVENLLGLVENVLQHPVGDSGLELPYLFPIEPNSSNIDGIIGDYTPVLANCKSGWRFFSQKSPPSGRKHSTTLRHSMPQSDDDENAKWGMAYLQPYPQRFKLLLFLHSVTLQKTNSILSPFAHSWRFTETPVDRLMFVLHSIRGLPFPQMHSCSQNHWLAFS